jgi:hypothetical protein
MTLIERLEHEIAHPDTSGAPYVNDPDLLAECLAEIKRLTNEVDDLRGFIDGLKPHIREAAAMYGLATRDKPTPLRNTGTTIKEGDRVTIGGLPHPHLNGEYEMRNGELVRPHVLAKSGDA